MLNYSCRLNWRFTFFVRNLPLTTVFQAAPSLALTSTFPLLYLLHIPLSPKLYVLFIYFVAFPIKTWAPGRAEIFTMLFICTSVYPITGTQNISCQKEREGEGRKRIDACCCASLTVPTAGHNSCSGQVSCSVHLQPWQTVPESNSRNTSNRSETGLHRTHNRKHESPS